MADRFAILDDLDHALQRLDGNTHTLVILEGEGEAHLAVGGGGGRYVVYATFDNVAFWNLVDPGATTGSLIVNAGGQEGDYAVRQVVDLTHARAAAHGFFSRRELDPDQMWEPG